MDWWREDRAFWILDDFSGEFNICLQAYGKLDTVKLNIDVQKHPLWQKARDIHRAFSVMEVTGRARNIEIEVRFLSLPSQEEDRGNDDNMYLMWKGY